MFFSLFRFSSHSSPPRPNPSAASGDAEVPLGRGRQAGAARGSRRDGPTGAEGKGGVVE